MADNTSIEWADSTWNPVTGCVEVSPGCDHCYAKTFAERFRGVPGHHFENGFDLQLRPARLTQPLRWKRPRRIFVNSMSDLFHDEVPDAYIAAVWAVMAATPQHTYQVLTKRHGRMRSFLTDQCSCGAGHPNGVHLQSKMMWAATQHNPDWVPGLTSEAVREGSRGMTWNRPLPNVWVGVSVETQQWADIRIPALIETPAAVRFLSMEPLLGPVDLLPFMPPMDPYDARETDDWVIDWVIAGGESGHGARPMHLPWVQSIRDQCELSNTAFLFKQWGEWQPQRTLAAGIPCHPSERFGEVVQDVRFPNQTWHRLYKRIGKKAAGRELDGRTWDEFPQAVNA